MGENSFGSDGIWAKGFILQKSSAKRGIFRQKSHFSRKTATYDRKQSTMSNFFDWFCISLFLLLPSQGFRDARLAWNFSPTAASETAQTRQCHKRIKYSPWLSKRLWSSCSLLRADPSWRWGRGWRCRSPRCDPRSGPKWKKYDHFETKRVITCYKKEFSAKITRCYISSDSGRTKCVGRSRVWISMPAKFLSLKLPWY